MQIILLGTRGQTIGKMLIKIAIVDKIDKTPPGFVRAALIRQLPTMILTTFLPRLAGVYLLVDSAFIFGSARRCVHDYLAGTVVVESAPN